MHCFLVVLECTLAACVYGMLHDQITVRVCGEYFTIGHPPVFDTDSPTLLALSWGIFATWWMGLLLGIGLGLAARAGTRPKRSARSLFRPIAMLMALTGLGALLAGIVGFTLAESGFIWLEKPLYNQVPRELHSRFLADLWAHSASYVVGAVGGVLVIVRVWRTRIRPVRALS